MYENLRNIFMLLRRVSYHPDEIHVQTFLQGGPVPVINGVITLLIWVITSFITGRAIGPSSIGDFISPEVVSEWVWRMCRSRRLKYMIKFTVYLKTNMTGWKIPHEFNRKYIWVFKWWMFQRVMLVVRGVEDCFVVQLRQKLYKAFFITKLNIIQDM